VRVREQRALQQLKEEEREERERRRERSTKRSQPFLLIRLLLHSSPLGIVSGEERLVKQLDERDKEKREERREEKRREERKEERWQILSRGAPFHNVCK
jgi:hypothetical protein